jgi:hypothetical protein
MQAAVAASHLLAAAGLCWLCWQALACMWFAVLLHCIHQLQLCVCNTCCAVTVYHVAAAHFLFSPGEERLQNCLAAL